MAAVATAVHGDGHGRAGGDDAAARTALPWLIRLRWLALVLFLALPFGSETGPGGRGPSALFLALIVAMGVTNAALWRATRSWRVPRRALAGAVLVLDTAMLTGLLSLSGGASNPGTVVYLVQITFAAVLLGPTWAWGLTALSVAAFGLLFLRGAPPPGGHLAGAPATDFDVHVAGMWIAFAATASLIAHFVSHVAGALSTRERELADARAAAARNERLAALTTLAAGAAHELSTPLATIAVTAREIVRAAEKPHCRSCAADAALIGAEVDRCHRLLDQMSARARGRSHDSRPLDVAAALEQARRAMSADDAARVDVSPGASAVLAALAHDDIVGVVVALLRNALDASPPGARVAVGAVLEGAHLVVRVEDRGTGMSPDVVAQATEPFFTTKPAGAGLGLGLFLARSVAEQLGGTLEIRSTVGRGTSVCLRMPAGREVRA